MFPPLVLAGLLKLVESGEACRPPPAKCTLKDWKRNHVLRIFEACWCILDALVGAPSPS